MMRNVAVTFRNFLPRSPEPSSVAIRRGRLLVARFVRLPERCPKCRALDPCFLETTSRFAWVDYYRCDDCGHVWTISRDGRRRVTHVTPLG
jgi:hypothetical protein